ncbi:carbohydrate binding family 9 domain-containing protein [Polaribacter sp.]|nr:carbohydrate binding family 9 domain-containing protein [Polaribacter sp.]
MKDILFFITLFLAVQSFSQTTKKSVFVNYIEKPIILDANLNEEVWQNSKGASGFWQYFPLDSIQAKQQATIKFLFDDDNLYVGIKVNALANDFIIPSLRRDFSAGGSDNITLLFDTFNDGTNAFIFGTNPFGIKREMLLSGGGSELRGFTMAWDTKWKCKTAIKEDHYVAEMIIPLSAFKYREGETKWRFNSYQFDTQDNVRNTWVNIPQNQFIFNLAYMGEMIFEKPLGQSKTPVSIIPYVNTITAKDFENDISKTDLKFGGDAKFTIGNSLNLDVTINPDFSQVEVDQQVTNLTRFEISLPERRQFFIENSDLFADFGNNRDSNPFFSRRIGIAQDANGNIIESNIIGGVRLSGKVNNDLRVGLLTMQTAEDIKNEIPTVNNAVITLQQKVFKRSNISVMFINKQATKEYDFLADEDKYNRIIGLDYRLASEDNTWVGKYFLHKSFSQGVKDKNYSVGFSTQYFERYFNVRLSGVYVGDNYKSDLGFLRRTDIFKITPKIERTFWPIESTIQKHSFSITPIFIWKPDLNFKNSDYAVISRWKANFKNTGEFTAEMYNRFTYLFSAFDPTGTDGAIALPIDSSYKYTTVSLGYRSDKRKTLSYQIEPSIGTFFNGEKYSFEANLAWRIQPKFSGSLQINYDKINLPYPYPDASIWLIGPKIDLTFNKSIFWSTFIQYSSQQKNIGVNTRLQWRFAPLSDLFIVYNDNYFSNSFTPRFKSLNLKLTYWLNI